MLSIIVPFLNEAQEMPKLCSHLQVLKDKGCEIILIDGGSEDDSLAITKQHGFPVLRAAAGRANQMNAGAATATGDTLLFLHADTRLPDSADTDIIEALQSGQYLWGRFDIHIDGKHPLLNVIAWFINQRSRMTSIATGDQGIFVKRALFQQVGGFPEQDLMEDIALTARLKKWGQPHCITTKISTSGRRWETQGVVATVLLMWRLRLAYWLGAPPETLKKQYTQVNRVK
ncbi:MAG: TIGR04283 family arsenosugar biosynthesis glycosyltransferase [Gammaproteobacteria bacterium]|nr:TIGR04283 family arsenosugar biosynthesis glycosyltransferase [Gammaproteobacteria bacterium]